MSDSEKEKTIEIKKGFVPEETPREPDGGLQAGYVPEEPPKEPPEEPPEEPTKE